MAATKSVTASRDLASELVFLTRALKAPTLRDSAARLAERARTESWSHEEYLTACLQREVAARDAHGGEGRIRAARFRPAKASRSSTLIMPAASLGKYRGCGWDGCLVVASRSCWGMASLPSRCDGQF